MSEKPVGILKTLLSINTSSHYDRDVNPKIYEGFVNFYGRKRIGEHIAETFLNYLPTDNTSPKKVLDIGAGTGIISEALQAHNYQVTAVDLSKNALTYLREKRPNTDAAQLDMNADLPFAPESFDGITTYGSNRYIDDPAKLLSETWNVLKPGGVFLWPLIEYESVISLKTLKMLFTQNPKRLREKALAAGFRDVKIIKPSLLEIAKIIIKKRIRPEYIPNFIVATK